MQIASSTSSNDEISAVGKKRNNDLVLSLVVLKRQQLQLTQQRHYLLGGISQQEMSTSPLSHTASEIQNKLIHYSLQLKMIELNPSSWRVNVHLFSDCGEWTPPKTAMDWSKVPMLSLVLTLSKASGMISVCRQHHHLIPPSIEIPQQEQHRSYLMTLTKTFHFITSSSGK